MKRIFAALMMILVLTACSASPVEEDAAAVQETEIFAFTRENFPRLDGSTSTKPLGRAIASVLLGEERENVEDLVDFSRTTASFRALMEGRADLLIVAEPSPVVFEELDKKMVEITMEPFATDALIFVVNENNPVDSLTADEIRKIYAGEITNWREVGGEDIPIDAFQRNAESGSQVLMEKLVMGDIPMMTPPRGYMLDEMGGLMAAVRGYDNSASAIGYSVYYYAHDMEMAEGLKIIAVDGATPCAETIRSGAYPFRNPYYVVKRSDADENTAILYDWILSPEGQKLVDMEGYVSILEVE